MFEIVAAEISLCKLPFATPLNLSSGSMEPLTQATASVTSNSVVDVPLARAPRTLPD